MSPEILINRTLIGASEKKAGRDVCDGWTISYRGTVETNKYRFSSIGNAEEQRTRLQINEVSDWFRLMQPVKPNTSAKRIRASLTCGQSGQSLDAKLVRLAVVGHDQSGYQRPHVNLALNVALPKLPETLEFDCPLNAMRPETEYSLVLQFDSPVDIDIWDISLRYLTEDGVELNADNEINTNESELRPLLDDADSLAELNLLAIENHTFSAHIDKADSYAISGWAVSQEIKSSTFDVDVYIDGLYFASARNDRRRDDLGTKGLSAGKGGFRLTLPAKLADKAVYKVSIRLPDGSFSTTKSMKTNSRSSLSLSASIAGPDSPDAVSVIIPVYNAFEDLCECLELVQEHSPLGTKFILIDDKSTDDRILPFLQKAAELNPNLKLISNEINSGFSNSINRGINAAGSADVVILNSDARVSAGWLEGLCKAARSKQKVATVTPLSDNAGAFSAPEIGKKNELPLGSSEASVAAAVRRHSDHLYPEVPTGNGFCMFISRASIDDIGLFDAEAFPKGYGEENDFCMRARRAGWLHLLDDATYVFHERSVSFGNSKDKLMLQGRAIVDERYPEYSKLTAAFRSSTMDLIRYRTRQAMEAVEHSPQVLQRALFVYSTQTGGTPQTNRDLMLQLQDKMETWTLRCNGFELFLEKVETTGSTTIATHQLNEPINPVDHRSAEYDQVVRQWLRKFDIALVHIRHLVWHSLGLPEVASSQDIPVVLSFHDFYSVCPSVNLIDEKNRYCGGTCTKGAGTCGNPLWAENSLPALKHKWVYRWRELHAEVFPFCSEFITTSNSARSVIEKAFPMLSGKVKVIPHGRTLTMTGAAHTPVGSHEPIKILLPGNIGVSKGLEVVHQLLDEDAGRTLEFHVLGTIKPEDIRPGIVAHGAYTRDEIVTRINNIAPTVAAVFSIWDETWCHTLTEMWGAGLPTIVLDFGTLRSRMETCGGGWVFSHEDPAELHRNIISAVNDSKGVAERREAIARWQRTTGKALNSTYMAARYLEVYRSLFPRLRKQSSLLNERSETAAKDVRIAVVCPSEKCQKRAPASTQIRMWSRTRSSLTSRFNYFRCNTDQFLAGLNCGEITHAILQRNVIPSDSMRPVLDAIAQGRLKVLYDIDDNLLNVPDQKDPRGIYHEYAQGLRELIASANIVTVSTDSLHNEISPLNPRTEILPNLLDETIWHKVDSTKFDRDEKKVTAIYMGSRTHDDDLNLLLPAFEEACRRVPNLYLKIVGGFATAPSEISNRVEIIDVPNEAKSYPQFVSFIEQVSRDVDFALAPLLDTPFNACKSELKALEYAGLGLSGLFSDVDTYKEVTQKIGTGHLVSESIESWTNAIVIASYNKHQLHEEGLVARKRVLSEFTIANSTDQFDDLIESLLETPSVASDQIININLRKKRIISNGN